MHGRHNVKSYCNKCRGDSEGVHSVHWNALTGDIPDYCTWLFVHSSILKVVAKFVVIFKPQGLGRCGNLKEKHRKTKAMTDYDQLQYWNNNTLVGRGRPQARSVVIASKMHKKMPMWIALGNLGTWETLCWTSSLDRPVQRHLKQSQWCNIIVLIVRDVLASILLWICPTMKPPSSCCAPTSVEFNMFRERQTCAHPRTSKGMRAGRSTGVPQWLGNFSGSRCRTWQADHSVWEFLN